MYSFGNVLERLFDSKYIEVVNIDSHFTVPPIDIIVKPKLNDNHNQNLFCF